MVQEFKELDFFRAIKWICDVCGYDYYENILESTELIDDWNWIRRLKNAQKKIENEVIKVLPETVLNQFIKMPNKLFLKDNIDIKTQKEFELGIGLYPDERIIIPIRSETGDLVGIKGRTLESNNENKYIYLYPCPKSKILYGLDKTLKFAKQENELIIVEAEKGLLQAWSYGIKNVVALGGKHLSASQAEKILRLNLPINIALDKDVKKDEVIKIVKTLRIGHNPISVIWDNKNVLNEKESPMDNYEKWKVLYQNRKIYRGS